MHLLSPSRLRYRMRVNGLFMACLLMQFCGLSFAHSEQEMVPAACSTHPIESAESAYHKKLLDRIAKYVRRGAFSGTVLVARPTVPGAKELDIFGRSFAYAEDKTHIVNRFDTQFRIGSITKQFTAAAILQLIEKKKLELSTKLSQVVPGFRKTGNAGKLTIEHLLTHTSGLPDYSEGEIPGAGDEQTPAKIVSQLVRALRKTDSKAAGTFAYNNTNYVLLGRIIEIRSGQNYLAYLKTNLFAAAGMTRSGVGLLGSKPDHARGYEQVRGALVPVSDHDVAAGGSGALFSTAEDIFRWVKTLHESNKILSSKMRDEMTTARADRYGFGVESKMFKYQDRRLRVIEHDGAMSGYSALVSYLPQERITVVLLSNVENAPNEILRAQLMTSALEY